MSGFPLAPPLLIPLRRGVVVAVGARGGRVLGVDATAGQKRSLGRAEVSKGNRHHVAVSQSVRCRQ